jgi:dTDP-4-amino-4,6-dideoxygalactose transaminase
MDNRTDRELSHNKAQKAQIKNEIGELAIFGGTPAFVNALHVGQPNIGNREKFAEQINDILDRRWLTNGGSYVTEFERRIAETVDVAHCVAMCNATVGLEIAIRALGLTGEVIVPSFTFVATAHALQWQEITPVFCDIDPRTHSLDPKRVEELITSRTTGIIGVHLWGKPCDIDGLNEIARRHELKLLFDSAHAFGCSHKGRMIGNFGDAEVFSFHATKFLNSLEGGAVVTNDARLAETLRLMRNFGFTTYDQTRSIGVNGKMNEISAAMGLTNLDSMAEFIAINRRHLQQYQDQLAGFAGISFLPYDKNERSNYQYVVLEVDESKSGVTRDQLMQILHAENVLARRYFYPGCHKMEPYRSLYPDADRSLPQTEYVAARVLTLPTGQAITSEIIGGVCAIIGTVLENASEVRQRLEQAQH